VYGWCVPVSVSHVTKNGTTENATALQCSRQPTPAPLVTTAAPPTRPVLPSGDNIVFSITIVGTFDLRLFTAELKQRLGDDVSIAIISVDGDTVHFRFTGPNAEHNAQKLYHTSHADMRRWFNVTHMEGVAVTGAPAALDGGSKKLMYVGIGFGVVLVVVIVCVVGGLRRKKHVCNSCMTCCKSDSDSDDDDRSMRSGGRGVQRAANDDLRAYHALSK
jgi:hypothetical protein